MKMKAYAMLSQKDLKKKISLHIQECFNLLINKILCKIDKNIYYNNNKIKLSISKSINIKIQCKKITNQKINKNFIKKSLPNNIILLIQTLILIIKYNHQKKTHLQNHSTP